MSSKNLPAISKGRPQLESLSPWQVYMREVARYPLLTPEEEYDLALKHFEHGDANAAHRLVTSNLRLVVKIANDFRQAQNNLLDLVQEGNYGLMQAVKRFNPYKGVKLSSYAAWWIRAYILKYIMDNKSQVRIGTTAAQRRLFYKLRSETEKLIAEYEKADTKLLASRLDVTEQDVIDMQQRLAAPDMSLDEPLGDDSSATKGSLLAGNQRLIDDELADKEIQEVFAGYLQEFAHTLTGRDLEVFNARMIAETPATLQELGDRYGFTRERARQIEARIIGRLREFVKSKDVVLGP